VTYVAAASFGSFSRAACAPSTSVERPATPRLHPRAKTGEKTSPTTNDRRSKTTSTWRRQAAQFAELVGRDVARLCDRLSVGATNVNMQVRRFATNTTDATPRKRANDSNNETRRDDLAVGLVGEHDARRHRQIGLAQRLLRTTISFESNVIDRCYVRVQTHTGTSASLISTIENSTSILLNCAADSANERASVASYLRVVKGRGTPWSTRMDGRFDERASDNDKMIEVRKTNEYSQRIRARVVPARREGGGGGGDGRERMDDLMMTTMKS
jgi:hypothetical protein